jgi:hypothetical protein
MEVMEARVRVGVTGSDTHLDSLVGFTYPSDQAPRGHLCTSQKVTHAHEWE